MKNVFLFILFVSTTFLMGCQGSGEQAKSVTSDASSAVGGGQSGVQDDVSQKDVVKVAIGSPDHTTLVKAVQAAELVDVLSNAGPFTVFAPTNAAFDQLPAGTVEGLLKPDKKNDLADVLQYHVTLSALDARPAPLSGYMKPKELEAPLKYFAERKSEQESFVDFNKKMKKEW